MAEGDNHGVSDSADAHQPALLLPGSVTVLCLLMVGIHAAIVWLLPGEWRGIVLEWFAFVPAALLEPGLVAAGGASVLWTAFTHAFLHAGWEHVIFNTIWLAIFGTPVARRYGTTAMLLIFLISAAVGAIAFAATTLPEVQLLVGASGGVAGLTGAAVRFMFQPVIVGHDPETGEARVLGRRLATVREVFITSRARAFTLIWILLNAAVPLLPLVTGGAGVQIAWQAHLGGFFTGLFLVAIFEDRYHRQAPSQ